MKQLETESEPTQLHSQLSRIKGNTAVRERIQTDVVGERTNRTSFTIEQDLRE